MSVYDERPSGQGGFSDHPRRDLPRYTRTMGIVRWVILAAVSVFAIIMILNYLGAFGSDGGAQDADVRRDRGPYADRRRRWC